MQKIGLLSDTHGYWDEKFVEYFSSCDEIWHAGDIGNSDILYKLEAIKPVRAVHGNIDGYPVRSICPKFLRFKIEELDVWMTHIGGYPGHYAPEVRPEIFKNPPGLFVCGHSHILKVQYDTSLKLLHINPGAAGKQGFHQVRTIIRFCIDGKDVRDLEVIEFAG